MSEPMTAKERIRRAGGRKSRDVRINLGEHLAVEHQRANAELEELIATAGDKPQRLSSKVDPAIEEKAAEVSALEAEMEDFWQPLTLTSWPFNKWRDFKEDHPPNNDIAEDKHLGVNTGAIVDALDQFVTAPDLDAEDWAGIHDKANPADLVQCAAIVAALHEVTSSVPKSRLVSAVQATADEASELLANSVSPSAASTGGSRKRSTSTSTRKGA
jgi:hypothetical protein